MLARRGDDLRAELFLPLAFLAEDFLALPVDARRVDLRPDADLRPEADLRPDEDLRPRVLLPDPLLDELPAFLRKLLRAPFFAPFRAPLPAPPRALDRFADDLRPDDLRADDFRALFLLAPPRDDFLAAAMLRAPM